MATKLSKPKALELLDELGDLQRQQAALLEQRAEKLKPLDDRYKKACAPINALFNDDLTDLAEQIADKQKQVSDFLLAGFDAKTGGVKLPQLVGASVAGKAPVAVVKVGSKRQLNPERFFTEVKERTAEFWTCVTIGLQKAEAFLGKNRVGFMAKTDYTASVTFELREVVEELEEAA